MKSNEELNALKKEVEAVNEKLQELTPEELEQVNGGVSRAIYAVYGVSDLSLQSKVAGVETIPSAGQPGATASLHIK